MTVRSTAVTVTATATVLFDVTADDTSSTSPTGAHVIVRNTSGTAKLFLGGPDVTAANGLEVAAGAQSPTLTLSRGDALYGISDDSVSGTTTRVLVLGSA